MPRFENHRDHVDRLVAAAVNGAEPGRLLHARLENADVQPDSLVLAVGKAARPMARAFMDRAGDRVRAGVVVGPNGTADVPAPLTFMPADHPIPTRRCVEAAQAARELALEAARAGSDLHVLISGGASAMLTLPAEGLTIHDLRQLTEAMLRAAMPIEEINAVRKHCDRLKGGRLAALAHPARVTGWILSDVIGDRLDAIASGPTSPDPTTYAEAFQYLRTRHLLEAHRNVAIHLRRGIEGEIDETPKPGHAAFERVVNAIIGNNRTALEAAHREATSLGFTSCVSHEPIVHDVEHAAIELVDALLNARPPERPDCLLMGGEPVVRVGWAKGRGGRCQEIAMIVARKLADRPGFVFAAFATDGIDGPTDAAGAVVTGRTIDALRNIHPSIDLDALFDRHDSHRFHELAASLIRTGPTGTNVNDVFVMLRYP
jgi:hydroxypyruvate reductase